MDRPDLRAAAPTADQADGPGPADRSDPADASSPSAPAVTEPGLRGSLVPLLGVAVLVVLAVWGLGRRPFWLDEALSVGATRQLVETWRRTSGTMATYYLVLKPWSAVSISREWLRFLSVVITAAAVPLVRACARRVGSARQAAVATLAFAASWFTVRYAQEARSYALVLLLTTVSWFGLLEAVRATDAGEPDRARRAWRLFAVASVLIPLTQGLGALQLAAQVAALATRPDRDRWFRRLAPVAVATGIVVVLLFALGANAVGQWIPPVSLEQVGETVQAFTGPNLSLALVVGAFVVGGTVVTVRRALGGDAGDRWRAGAILAWAYLPPVLLLLVSLGRPYLVPRYLVGSLPGFALLVAGAIDAVPARLPRAAAAGILGLALLGGQVVAHDDRPHDWAGAVALVADRAEEGDGLVFTRPELRPVVDYAWQELDHTISPTPISPVDELGVPRRLYRYWAPDQLPRAVIDSGSDRIWLIDQHNPTSAATRRDLLEAEPVAERYRVTRRWRFDGRIEVLLLEVR